MAATTYVCSIAHVATRLGEDPELLEAIVSNDDNLTYGNIVSVHVGHDEIAVGGAQIEVEFCRHLQVDMHQTLGGTPLVGGTHRQQAHPILPRLNLQPHALGVGLGGSLIYRSHLHPHTGFHPLLPLAGLRRLYHDAPPRVVE